MKIYQKDRHEELMEQLTERFERLLKAFQPRALESPREGLGKRMVWRDPESRTAPTGTDSEIRIAVDDFKTILAEVRKCK